eukprot:1192027-Prorocentrum_minimum.AAC.4
MYHYQNVQDYRYRELEGIFAWAFASSVLQESLESKDSWCKVVRNFCPLDLPLCNCSASDQRTTKPQVPSGKHATRVYLAKTLLQRLLTQSPPIDPRASTTRYN